MKTRILAAAAAALALAAASRAPATVLLVAGGGGGATNLIVNGGFETGDFTGWITNPVSYPQFVVSAPSSPVQQGTYAAQIGGYSYGPDTLSQVVATTRGASYQLSFWYYQEPGIPSGFSASWDGSTIYTQMPNANTNGVYENVISTVLGTGSDTLMFTAYNDPLYTFLDNVSLCPVNNPCPHSASAPELLFNYTEPGGVEFSFEQSSEPPPITSSPGYETVVPVTEVSSNIGSFTDIAWYAGASSGQFDTDTSQIYVVTGPQIYSGSESDPLFATGVFAGADQTDGLNGTLTVTAVPEPATWLLLIAGVGGVGATLRRTRKVSRDRLTAALK